jgi:hypothetical protein
LCTVGLLNSLLVSYFIWLYCNVKYYTIVFFSFVTEISGRVDKPHTFTIYTRTSAQPLEVAADNEAEMRDWMSVISSCNVGLTQTVCICEINL